MTNRMNPRIGMVLVTVAVLGFAQVGSVRADESAPAPIGRYTPQGGFALANTEQGTLNLRLFTYIRYLNQQRLDASYTDSFGQTTAMDRRQDIHLNKINLQFMGWMMSPEFRYLAYVWTSGTSQGQTSQVVVGGT